MVPSGPSPFPVSEPILLSPVELRRPQLVGNTHRGAEGPHRNRRKTSAATRKEPR